MGRKESCSQRTRWDLAGLFFLSLGVRLITAGLISRPGYMDAAYYAAEATWLARGGGLTEPFVWNYLDDPVGLPHTGFLYWMPLPSLLAAPFAALFPASFFALQLPFVLFSAVFPLVAYKLAWEVCGGRREAWVAGLFTLFSGFFSPFWTLPATFAPFALFGSLALWLAGRRRGRRISLLVGLLVGLAHLTRADGILLLPVVALAPLARSKPEDTPGGGGIHTFRPLIVHLLLVAAGYLLVMGPWFGRNILTIGAPLSPAGAQTLWLRDYNDFFCYSCDLSLSSYLAWGWRNIVSSKLAALGINFQRFLAENCQVFLFPFVIVGLYRLRRRSPFVLFAVYFSLLYLMHSLVFTFPGWRGGFFHSSGAGLPFLYAAGGEGLRAGVGWAARRRRWNPGQAHQVFAAAAVAAAMMLSGYALTLKLPAWRSADAVYQEIGAWLDAREVPGDTIVMVANPPAFYYHAQVAAVVVPNGDVGTLLAVADRYRVTYVVLDQNHPRKLAELYQGLEVPGLELVATFGDGEVRVYRR